MKLRLNILFMLCFFFFTANVYANETPTCVPKENKAPRWTKMTFWRGSKSIVTVVRGIGINAKDAKREAEIDLEKKILFHLGLVCNVKDYKLHSCDNGKFGGTVKFEICEELEAVVNKKCEYIVYMLVQLPNDTEKDVDNVGLSNNYPFSSRVFVPGMAQIYKGQNVKGALFIAGEVLFIGGIAASFGTSSYFKYRSEDKSLKLDKRNAYENSANAAYYAGWGFVGLAAALYIANIIDGAASPGEEALFKIETDDKGKEKKIKIVFAPSTTFDSVGLAMNLNF